LAMMTVGELIKELRKWPKDMRVAFTSHDNSGDETQGYVRTLNELEDGEDLRAYGPTVVLGP